MAQPHQQISAGIAPARQREVEQRIAQSKLNERAERYAAFLTPIIRAVLLTGSLLSMVHFGLLP